LEVRTVVAFRSGYRSAQMSVQCHPLMRITLPRSARRRTSQILNVDLRVLRPVLADGRSFPAKDAGDFFSSLRGHDGSAPVCGIQYL